MPVPDYQTLMLPVLRLLGDAADHAAGSVIEALASEFRLTPEEREQLVGSQRVSLMASRAHWAMTYLAQAGLSDRPRRGVWRITDEGRRLLATDPERIDNALLAQYEGFQSFISRSAGEPGVDETEVPESGGDGAEAAADVPSVDDLHYPMLVTLSDGKPHAFPELVKSICDALHVDDDMRGRRLASGQTVMYNRVGWTRTNLAKAGLVDNPDASVVVLTDAGKAFLASHPGPVDTETLKRDCPPFLNWLADMGAIPATERRDRGAPTVWMVRAGEGGVHAPIFVQQGAVFLGWGAASDISCLNLEAVSGKVADAWPEYSRRQRGQAANALYKFAMDMQPGDVVLTPEPASRTVLLGEVAGGYRYLTPPVVADYSHARPVTWRARISRDELSYGANSLSTQITLSQPPHVAEFFRLFEAHAADEEVSDLLLRTFLLRHSILMSRGTGLTLIGSRFDPDTRRLLEVLARNRLVWTWLDLEASPEAEQILQGLDVPVGDLPIIIVPGGPVLRNPGSRALLDALGISGDAGSYPPGVCDLLVVGTGPAGLAAAVYGASDGMATTLAEDTALGGQAGTSSRIENYLGFPAGLSGEELAARGTLQAQKFGVRIKLAAKAVALSFQDGVHRSHSMTTRPLRPGRSSSQQARGTTGFPWTAWPSSRASRCTTRRPRRRPGPAEPGRLPSSVAATPRGRLLFSLAARAPRCT